MRLFSIEKIYMGIYEWSFLSSGTVWGWTILFAFITYLLGSISTGRVYAKIRKIDLTKTGSGNVGATNAGRAAGKKGFALVLLGDVAKVIIAGGIMQILKVYTVVQFSLPIALSFAVIGNNYPIFFKFKGGKGVSAIGGFMLFVSWPLALVMLGTMFLGLMVGRRVSLASITAILLGSVFVTFYPYMGGFNDVVLSSILEPGFIVSMWSITVVAVWKHRTNIIRSYNQTEPTIEKMKPFQDFFAKITFTTKWVKEWRKTSEKNKKQ